MRGITALLLAVLLAAVTSRAQSSESSMKTSDYLHVPFKTITGDTANLAVYTGQVVLIVNVASKCGYTPQYAGLEKLYEKYRDRGLVVIGFPANDFKQQEPGTDAEILAFCTTTYGVSFPMMSKIGVKGEDEHPLYTYLTKESPFRGEITWNFNKFLLDRRGGVVARFESRISPEDPDLVAKIEAELEKK